ncbi:MAG TPA: hypothetical protein VK464_01045 [Symbiobacteriaceae bacterium]|jgi:cobyric acid synthase|nr:hypothetical protein [Symbiobacteriaceae bacterium]
MSPFAGWTRPEQLAGADLVLLPGSARTLTDLRWLQERGLAAAIAAHSQAKGATIGLCGGYHMLGALHFGWSPAAARRSLPPLPA